MDKLKEAVDLRLKAFEAQLNKLRSYMAEAVPDGAKVEAQMEVVEAKVQALYNAQNQVIDGYLKVNDEQNYLDAEEAISNIQMSMATQRRNVSEFFAKLYPQPSVSASTAPILIDQKLNLPQMKLPTFSGDVREWLAFRASFSVVDQNKTITDDQRFQYLLHCLKEGSYARKLVEDLPICGANYQAAVNKLADHYGRPKMLVKVYVLDLLQLVIENHKRESTDLMDLVPKLSSKISNLSTLGVTSDRCEDILYPVLESCLPEAVLTTWQANPNYEEKLAPLMTFLNSEVRNKMDRTLARMNLTGGTESAVPETGKQKQKVKQEDIPTGAVFLATQNNERAKEEKSGKCSFCGNNHETFNCITAKSKMSLEQREAIVKEKRLCFRCLGANHNASRCRAYLHCVICSGRHYELMCRGPGQNSEQATPGVNMLTTRPEMQMLPPQQQLSHPQSAQASSVYLQPPQQQQLAPAVNNQASGNTQPTGNYSNFTGRSAVALQTILVKIETPLGHRVVRAFVDEGSEESFILESVAQEMQCFQIGQRSLQHQVFGGAVTTPEVRPQYKITIGSVQNSNRVAYHFNSVRTIARGISTPPPGKWVSDLAQLGIYIPVQTTDDVHLLIGMDIAAHIWTGRFHRLSGSFFARETIFGWVVGGSVSSSNEIQTTSTHMITSMMLGNMTPEDMWSLEILGIRDEPRTHKREELEQAAVHHFESTVARLPDGRYEVELPFISGHQDVKNNSSQAIASLHRLTNDLESDGHLGNYFKILENWSGDGIIELVGDRTYLKTGYYMPHRHVVKDSATTPIRPVFNASAKARGSVSLNDILEKGPNTLEMIPAIMMRFRRYEFGVVADIAKAFLQISIKEQHRDFLRFLWWRDENCKEIAIYRHKRVVFGVRPSPFLLAAVLTHHINTNGTCEELSRSLMDSLYVDNSVLSFPSLEAAREFQDYSQNLLLPAKFDLRGWEYSKTEEGKLVPVLGMDWHTKDDTLGIHMGGVLEKLKGPMTKRGLLSMVNTIFDPMGFVSPFTLIPKLLFQEACLRNLTYDEPLPEDLRKKFEKWKSQVPELAKLKIPRWMASTNSNKVAIHTFCDGSQDAFATCIYLRSEDENGDVEVQLICAKPRVAPARKALTIPRLELMACLIGVRLTNQVIRALSMEDIPIHYWSDSTTALAYIQRNKPWATFVSNRVDEIRRSTQADQWRHVPGEYNPADLPSRGCQVSYLLEQRWHEGPDWLREVPENWPSLHGEVDEEAVQAETKKTVTSAPVICADNFLQRMSKFTDYNRLLRAMVGAQRYINKLRVRIGQRREGIKLPVPRRQRGFKYQSATVEEVESAERVIMKLVQKETLIGPEDKLLRGMNAFKDEEGLIRIKSQLLYGNDDYNIRCPVVLSAKCEIVRMMIRKVHETNSHAGLQTLQGILRNRYWILKSRRAAGDIISSCATCRRFVARKCEVPPTQLPIDRVRDTVCFDITGVDLAGPLFIKGGDKVWVVLYTCAVYRAVHLELVPTLSTEGFIRTFRRFIARRGRPSIVYSDNGLNFVGCNNLFRQINWDEIQRYATVERISWKFNPPTAAWWGGWWEKLVGMMKTLVRRILGKSILDFDELQTILCDVESTMNRRPLTFMSDRSGDLMPICPSYHMKDNPVEGLPEADAVDTISLRKSVKKCQQLREELRSRFRRDYLAMLRHNNGIRKLSVKVGDVVLIGNDNDKRIDWPLGVVEEVYPGRDGQVRSALIRTKDGKYLRALQRLYLLEVGSTGEAEERDVAGESE